MNDVTESKPDSPEKFVARLRAIGEAAYHDKHPFHVLMHQGKLTRRQLQAWIENRFYYQWTIPKKDALILAKADDPEFRRAWITRITDHDGIGNTEGGIRKWYKLSEAAAVQPRIELLEHDDPISHQRRREQFGQRRCDRLRQRSRRA